MKPAVAEPVLPGAGSSPRARQRSAADEGDHI
jgi:hypothetical protein